jgi:2-polyprenyl-6-methoxyphenol hydroxylase-like FAD-dependent oxidoreductase
MSIDVLIVGAGPTGLMLANQLARRGIRATIIDRHSGPAQQTRAMAVQARTLEIYSKLGLADRALELGTPGNGANMWAEGRLKARIPFEEMGKNLSPFPFVLMLGQDDNERIMGDHLRQWNVAVQWNTELIALEQHASHVTATIKDPGGSTRIIEAAYVAGCDGGRSAVRELNNIGFPGAPYEHSFFVADTVATGPMVPDELNVYLWRTGFHLYFPMHGTNRWRVIGILPKNLETKPDLTFADLVPSLRQEGGAVTFTSCLWLSTYRIHHRRTERFRDRRCFLLGDAAHVHSPMGGQGMNTGLQDAYNLAWKLALVVSRQADGALLDSYEAERLPVADRLLATTDRAFRFVVSGSWLGGLFRTKVFPNVAALAMGRECVRRAAFRTISQVGITYRQSPLSRTLPGLAAKAPQAGDRFPWLQLTFQGGNRREDLFQRLDDTRFNLLAIGQPAPMVEKLGLGDLLNVHVVPFEGENVSTLGTVSITAPAFYLLRPDGHVGLAGARVDEAALARWFSDAHVHPGQRAAQTIGTVVGSPDGRTGPRSATDRDEVSIS